ncbi:ankyrin repeat-containing domain protein [Hypoxylon cercidicola]|nr:ankyrin repeat-containing domain protein [Hypoxylon cercidicola]
MGPLQIAAKYGHEQIVRALIEAGCQTDMKFPLTEVMVVQGPFSLVDEVIHNTGPRSFVLLDALCVAIIHGNVSIAEHLATRCPEILENTTPMVWDLVSAFQLAALYKMPSVIRIILARGYRPGTNWYFIGGGALHLAAANDNNVEVLELLLEDGVNIHATDRLRRDAFRWAIDRGCMANAVFLAEYCSPEDALAIATRNMRSLLSKDDFLPITKFLFEKGRGATQEH